MSSGVFATNQLPVNFAALSFAEAITMLSPNGQAPLFALTARMKTETALQVEHGYYSKTMIFPTLVGIASAQAANLTTLECTNTNNCLPNMVYRVEATGENVLIEAVLSPTQVRVRRGFGTVVAAIIPSGGAMHMAGTAFPESSLRPGALRLDAVPYSNLTQTFRNTWAVSGSTAATSVVAGESNIASNKKECAIFHANEIERALFLGQKVNSFQGGQPLRAMEGVIANTTLNAAGNITTLGATTNLTQLEAAIDPTFDQDTDAGGDGSRVLFVGGVARRVINQIGRLSGNYQIVNGATSFGLQFQTVQLSRGLVHMIEHRQFNGFGKTSVFARMGVVVDIPTFSIAYLNGRKTEHKSFNTSSDAVDNGIDATGGTITTECTALFKNPQANAVLYNFTAGAV